MRFSERWGIRQPKTEIQLNSMDDALRAGLWNAFQLFFLPDKPIRSRYRDIRGSTIGNRFEVIWFGFLKRPLDTIPWDFQSAYKVLRELFFQWEWHRVYDFLQYVAHRSGSVGVDQEGFTSFCNSIMQQELSGYRFIDDCITPITDQQELREIVEAIDEARRLRSVRAHLRSALDKLSDRKNPDYRNSIKESISAVEAICRVISQKDKATLGQALNAMADGNVDLHGALRAGFEKIYGYTSDADGIRHAMLGEPQVDFEDAKYMMVSCSAFINYLLVKASKAGIKLR